MQFSDDILIGSGEQTETMCETITLPSSRPHNVECVQDSENQLTFKWNEPINIAPDIEVDNYNFKLVKGKFHYELITEPTTTELTTEPITTEPTTTKPTTTEPITTEPTTTEPATTEPTTTEPITTEPTTTEPIITELNTTELSTKPSKHPESSTPITTVPNSSLNPMPISKSFSPERPEIFSRFLDFLDFLSFARSKDENVLRVAEEITEEVTTPKNVYGI